MEQQNYITICHDYNVPFKEELTLKENLELKKFIILNDDILDIDNNRQINVQAYYQLRQRSPNNPYVFFLHSKMIEKKIEELEKSDVILVYNPNDGIISHLIFFYITISWYLSKKIYLWTSINKKLPFYNEIFSLDIPIINTNINNIIPPIKGNPYKEEVKNLIIENTKNILIDIEKPKEERITKTLKKKLIKKQLTKKYNFDEGAPF